MASVERTAYPLLPSQLPAKELHRSYTLSESEIEWVNNTAKSPALSIGLAVQLKIFQQMHYFVPFDELPQELIEHVRQCLRYGARIVPRYSNPRTLYRHQAAIRQYLQVTPFYNSDGFAVTEQIARDCALILEQRVDLINTMIDELIQRGYELPAYSTLNKVAETALANAQEITFNLVVMRTPIEVIYKLKEMLDTDFGRRQSDFNALKQAPKKPSRKHLEVLIDHLAWLEAFGELDVIFNWHRGFQDPPLCRPGRRVGRRGAERLFLAEALHLDVGADLPHAGSDPRSLGGDVHSADFHHSQACQGRTGADPAQATAEA